MRLVGTAEGENFLAIEKEAERQALAFFGTVDYIMHIQEARAETEEAGEWGETARKTTTFRAEFVAVKAVE